MSSVSSSLAPLVPSASAPWNRRRVLHLLRRTGFSGTNATVEQMIRIGPSTAVQFMMDVAVNTSPIARPSWVDLGGPYPGWTAAQVSAEQAERAVRNVEFRNNLALHILGTGIHGKLTLFWHSHFATEYEGYFRRPQFAYHYIKVIQDHLLGDFKQMTHDMGITPAMLSYLNGNLNQRTSPNENYARELLELYTLGEGNGYTQNDIVELAKALTGYTLSYSYLWVRFDPNKFDNWNKTIFGVWDNFNYTTALNHLFTVKRELIARHICRKLYRFFVHATPNEEVVEGMAQIFLANGLRIEPVLRTLFASQHFYEDALMGAMISSPYELLGNYMTMLNVPRNTTESAQFLRHTVTLEQNILEPPGVAGWPGHREWLNTSLLPNRWNSMNLFLVRHTSRILAFAKSLPDNQNPGLLVRHLTDFIFAVPLTDEGYDELTAVMLSGIPAYEWNINDPGASTRIMGLISHMVSMPEFQLN